MSSEIFGARIALKSERLLYRCIELLRPINSEIAEVESLGVNGSDLIGPFLDLFPLPTLCSPLEPLMEDMERDLYSLNLQTCDTPYFLLLINIHDICFFIKKQGVMFGVMYPSATFSSVLNLSRFDLDVYASRQC
jgi:hypothetical protein